MGSFRGQYFGAAAAAGLMLGHAAYADDYKLGQGVRIDDLKVSGYMTVDAEVPDKGKSELLADDLSLYVQGRFNRFFNPFFEAEIAGIPLLKEGEDPLSGKTATVVLERLYNDIYLKDDLTLRIGKSLSTVGEWNGIHAGPLVPTATRPLTTYRSFSEFISGPALIYRPSDEALPVTTLYWQPAGTMSHDLDTIENRNFRNIRGVNLSWNWDLENTVGLSLQEANIKDSDESQTLAGFNAHLVFEPFVIRTEATYTWLHSPRSMRVRDHEAGIFVQGEYNLNDRWALSARYEYFQDRDYVQASKNAVFGMAYRPQPPVVWKLEYLTQWGQELGLRSGVYASLAVLF
ncbi:porin [Kordiimonas marina]|uniref:porin n=1 Tax=Kordiimonas marina TaxID=2872312 RepID=UPI001FF43CA5|nr:porin [Kordiimonas marina]MCJ9429621.1 porin [Kordiimonas marina]